MSGEQQANELAQWFGGMPGIVQAILHGPYQWLDNALRSVAGKPDDVLAAIPKYLALADQVTQLVHQQQSDRARLVGQWTGAAFDSFSGRMQHTEDQMTKMSDAVRSVDGLMHAGANAATQGSNMISQLAKSLISYGLEQLVLALSTSAFDFGARLAAAIARVIGRAMQTISKVVEVIQKVVQVLNQVTSLFRNLEQIIHQVSTIMKEIKEVLSDARALVNATGQLTNTFQGIPALGHGNP